MDPRRNTKREQTPPRHYAIPTGANSQSLPPWVTSDDGHDRDQMPPIVDADETVSNVFSSLYISPTTHLPRRRLLPETHTGDFGGVGTPIEGSVHPFYSNAGNGSLWGSNAGSSSSHPRFYSGVGHVNPFTVDPHHNHQLLWRNRDVLQEVRSSRFDQTFDFDQLSDLLRKEHLYSTQRPGLPFPCSSNSTAAFFDETFTPNTANNLNFSRPVNDKLRNHQLLTRLSLKELRGRIRFLAKDQNGCRILQTKFENPTKEEVEIVLCEVLDTIKDLMKDQFGNYLIQKLIAVCNSDQKLRILLSLTNSPAELVLICMSQHGTRAMQKLLENLADPYQIGLAMVALRPGAARLANDPNGHHVIQYCLIHFPSDVNEPILNEIADKCFEVATDRSGCCVIQACMEHCHGEVRNRLISEILANAIHLAEDPYGNYVLQHMVELNVPEFSARLVRELQGNFASLSCNKYASNVVEKCLKESGEEICTHIVMELITSQNPARLLIDPYANFVIQCALNVSTGLVFNYLVELISDNISAMRSNLYGKKILAWFEKRRILGI